MLKKLFALLSVATLALAGCDLSDEIDLEQMYPTFEEASEENEPAEEEQGSQPSPHEPCARTLTIPLKCNAYVTPLDAESKQTPACADQIIYNKAGRSNDAEMVVDGWKSALVEQEPHQISIFFYTAYEGSIDLDLIISSSLGDAVLDVEVNGKTNRVEVESSSQEQVCYAGDFSVAHRGSVRVNIIPVSTSADSFPTISAIKVGGQGIGYATGKSDDVVFVAPEDLNVGKSYQIRRGPSCHFFWQTSTAVEYFYNETVIAEGDDIDGAYYMLTGGTSFYMGLQPKRKGENRCVLFSVWDTDTANGDLAVLVNKGDNVESKRFTHENEGVQNFYYCDWEAGKPYATLVRVRPEYIDGQFTGSSLYTGYFRGDDGWKFVAEVRRPNIHTYCTGLYSFSENYLPNRGWVSQGVEYLDPWVRHKNGQWEEWLTGRFSVCYVGSHNFRRDFMGGINEKGEFYLRNLGYIDSRTTPYRQFSRASSGSAAPDIDLEALEQLAAPK